MSKLIAWKILKSQKQTIIWTKLVHHTVKLYIECCTVHNLHITPTNTHCSCSNIDMWSHLDTKGLFNQELRDKREKGEDKSTIVLSSILAENRKHCVVCSTCSSILELLHHRQTHKQTALHPTAQDHTHNLSAQHTRHDISALDRVNAGTGTHPLFQMFSLFAW